MSIDLAVLEQQSCSDTGKKGKLGVELPVAEQQSCTGTWKNDIEETIARSSYLTGKLLSYYQQRREKQREYNVWDRFIDSFIYGKLTAEDQNAVSRLNHGRRPAWKMTRDNVLVWGTVTGAGYALTSLAAITLPDTIQYACWSLTALSVAMDFVYRLPRAVIKKQPSMSYDPVGLLINLPTHAKRHCMRRSFVKGT